MHPRSIRGHLQPVVILSSVLLEISRKSLPNTQCTQGRSPDRRPKKVPVLSFACSAPGNALKGYWRYYRFRTCEAFQSV